MALVKRVSVDGEDVDISDVSSETLLSLIHFTSADLTAVALGFGKSGGPFSDTEIYRKMRVEMLKLKLKALELEARRCKLEVDGCLL